MVIFGKHRFAVRFHRFLCATGGRTWGVASEPEGVSLKDSVDGGGEQRLQASPRRMGGEPKFGAPKLAIKFEDFQK